MMSKMHFGLIVWAVQPEGLKKATQRGQLRYVFDAVEHRHLLSKEKYLCQSFRSSLSYFIALSFLLPMYDTLKEILFFKTKIFKAYFITSYSSSKIHFKEHLFHGKFHYKSKSSGETNIKYIRCEQLIIVNRNCGSICLSCNNGLKFCESIRTFTVGGATI